MTSMLNDNLQYFSVYNTDGFRPTEAFHRLVDRLDPFCDQIVYLPYPNSNNYITYTVFHMTVDGMESVSEKIRNILSFIPAFEIQLTGLTLVQDNLCLKCQVPKYVQKRFLELADYHISDKSENMCLVQLNRRKSMQCLVNGCRTRYQKERDTG